VQGKHTVRGKRVDLSAIRCPTMAIIAERDTICPPPAATALLDLVDTPDTATLAVPGGHVGAVVGSRASRSLYPALADWFGSRLDLTTQASIAF
jgi:polyhydroxyalkanoate synthase